LSVSLSQNIAHVVAKAAHVVAICCSRDEGGGTKTRKLLSEARDTKNTAFGLAVTLNKLLAVGSTRTARTELPA